MDDPKPGTELLTDLAERITTHLITQHVPEDGARQIGDEIAVEMAAYWGGQLIYFPKGKFVILSKRDRLIFCEFTGRNQKELARKFDVSEQHIYRIIKAMRRSDLADRHCDLFASAAAK
jgi:Mor family transcriptional regulator